MSERNRSHGTIRTSEFKAPWWARNRHVQTIWPRFIQRRLPVSYRMERLTLPDEDFVDVAYGPKPDKATGIVAMFHGLEGSIRSHYAGDMMASLSKNGWQVVMMHFRSCSGEANNKPRAYHSGETGDPCYFLDHLEKVFPDLPKVAVGFSLGANMLLKLLGENPAQKWLKAAVAISPPFKLAECARSINQGFSRVYQNYLLKSMKHTLKKKMARIDYRHHLQLSLEEVDKIDSFMTFDEQVTAPLHGFDGAQDYYEKCSSFHYLSAIHCPTLVLHSIDDPFMNHLIIPDETDLAKPVEIELSERGGHVGFMQGTIFRPTTWLHQRVTTFIDSYLPSAPETTYKEYS